MNKKLIVITTVICLLPMFLGITLYDLLPDIIPSQWDSAGEISSYMGKKEMVFYMPVFMALCNIVVQGGVNMDPKRANHSIALKRITAFVVPIISVESSGNSSLTAGGRAL